MHHRNTATETRSSNSYRNFSKNAGETGTLEHRPATPSDASGSDVPVPSEPATETGTLALFVSTTLESWTGLRHVFARDVQINDTAYRRLDPEYYAWLRSRMNLAKGAHQAGQIDGGAYEALRAKFNGVHEWAMEHMGASALSEAVRNLDARDYRPAAVEADTAAPAGKSKAATSAQADAIALVDGIAEKALTMGWKRERLYGTGPLFKQDRGLACFLKPGDRLGEVTLQSIEIIGPPPVEARQHFYNPDVDQPWIRPVRP